MYRLQTQSRVKNHPDFIGRNRRAVKDGGKEGKRQVKDDMKQQEKGASDTVEISKSELEKLLKMAVSFQPPSPTHIRPDPSQIPGLQNQITGLQKYYQTPGMQNQITGLYQTPGMQNQIAGLQKYYQTPGMQNQMPGMHNQIQGCAQKAEKKKDPQQCEEYYPWGRPGGGAPIRTVSGALLTNYSTRGQEVEKTRNNIPQQTSVHSSSPQKPQFARGLGPHVDTFVLSQREEQRRKEQMHKAELAAQIAERQRQKEAEKWRKEEEEKEAERRVMRELEEMNRRSERERELKQQKAEEARLWQAELHAHIQEAEEAAVREKQRHTQQIHQPAPSYGTMASQDPKPSRIPLPSYRTASRRTFSQNSNFVAQTKNSHTTIGPSHPPAVAMEIANRPAYPQPRPPSPIVPALAKKLGLPATDRQPHISSPKPSSPPRKYDFSLHVQPPQTHQFTLPTLPAPQTHQFTLPTLPAPQTHQFTLPTLSAPHQHTGTPFPSHASHNVARQQQILNQLAVLREGILSQRKSVEQKMKLQRRRL
jgi:hypothetical protein